MTKSITRYCQNYLGRKRKKPKGFRPWAFMLLAYFLIKKADQKADQTMSNTDYFWSTSKTESL